MIVLLAFKILKKKKIVKNLIVVAKLRIIYSTWPNEIEKWDMSFTHTLLHGAKKDANFDKDVDIYFINYEGLPWLKKKLKGKNKNKFDWMVLDESSKIKNTNTARFRIIRKIAGLFKRRTILTGSPIPNGLKDIFGQVYFLDLGKTFGSFITKFLVDYFLPCGYMGYDWKLQEGAEKKIYKKLKGLVLRFGNEKLDLPPLTKVNREIELSNKAMALYKEIEKEFIVELGSGTITADSAGVLSGKLRQMVGGRIYDKNGDTHVVHDEKIEDLEEVIEELQGSPCLVLYEFRHELKALRERFPDAPYIGGGVSAKRGAEIEDEWNRGDLPILFGHTDSVAHGLNLQESGRHVVFFSLTWNLENYEQVIQRLWRQGQKNPVIVLHIIAKGTIDEAILLALEGKDRTQQALLDALRDFYKITKLRKLKMKKPEEAIAILKTKLKAFPKYTKNHNDWALTVLAMIHGWDVQEYRTVIYDLTGHPENSNEMVTLFHTLKKLIFKMFKIEEVAGEGYVGDAQLMKKHSGKKSIKAALPKQEYLNMNKSKFAKQKDSTTSKPKKKSTAKKKSVAKQKPSKKKVAAGKKGAIKKKTTAKKPATKKVATKKLSTTNLVNVKVGKEVPKETSVHGQIQAFVSKSKAKGGVAIDKIVTWGMKNLEVSSATVDERYIKDYVASGVRRNYLKKV